MSLRNRSGSAAGSVGGSDQEDGAAHLEEHTNRSSGGVQNQPSEEGNKLFVGSLSVHTTDDMVRAKFEPFGALMECKIMSESITNVSKGYAFVTFKNTEDAAKAREQMDGQEIDGTTVVVDFAKEKLQPWQKQWRKADARGAALDERPPPVNPANYKELPFDKANSIRFFELCTVLDAVRNKRGSRAKLDLIYSTTKGSLSEHLKKGSWYPIMRLLLPDLDRERPRYNLKEQAIAKLFVKSLGIMGKGNEDALRLLHWKDVGVQQQNSDGVGGAVGDFANVLREVLESRGFKSTTKKLTVGEINEKLDKLHQAHKQEDKEEVMIELIRSCNAAELYWLTRIVLKNMNCGLNWNSVLKRYHRDAIMAMESHGDLRRCLAELSDPDVSRPYCVELFQPTSPMLANPLRIDQATERLGDFIIEPKMDGDRMLVHIDKTLNPPKVMLFTRNMNDYTNRYGSPALFDNLLKAFDCKRCIIDGEMLAWDDVEDRLVEFGNTTTVANEMHDPTYTGKRWLFFMCFDALMIDDGRGQSEQTCVITGEPLRVRRSRLNQILIPNSRKVEMTPALYVTDPDLDNRHRIVMAELDKQLAIKGEGLVLKCLASPYIPGDTGRKAAFWVKIKPELVNGLQEELDCIILGGYFSEGRRRASTNALDPSMFLLGVPGGNKKDKDGHVREFFCVVKVGTGYSFKELDTIRRQLRPFLIRTSDPGAPRPTHFAMPVKKSDFPDVWLEPEHSIVVQVNGMEIFDCDAFSSGLNIRFPRVSRIRWDKAWYECTPLSEVRRYATDFKSGAGGGFHGRQQAVTISRLDAVHHKKAQLTTRKRQAPEEILRVGNRLHLDNVEVEDDAPLDGWTFFVYPNPASDPALSPVKQHDELTSVETVEAFLTRKGGKVVKTVSLSRQHDNLMYLADEKAVTRPSKQMMNVFATGLHDIIRIDSVVQRCDTGQDLQDVSFKDYLFMSASTKERMRGYLDNFGDSFTEKADLLSLDRCMKEVDSKGQDHAKQKSFTKDARKKVSSSARRGPGAVSAPPPVPEQPGKSFLDTYLELQRDEDDPLWTKSNTFRGVFAYFPSLSMDRPAVSLNPSQSSACSVESVSKANKSLDLVSSSNALLDTKCALALIRLHGGIICQDLVKDFMLITHIFISSKGQSSADDSVLRRTRQVYVNEIRPKAPATWREPVFVDISFIFALCREASHIETPLTWEQLPIHEYLIGNNDE